MRTEMLSQRIVLKHPKFSNYTGDIYFAFDAFDSLHPEEANDELYKRMASSLVHRIEELRHHSLFVYQVTKIVDKNHKNYNCYVLHAIDKTRSETKKIIVDVKNFDEVDKSKYFENNQQAKDHDITHEERKNLDPKLTKKVALIREFSAIAIENERLFSIIAGDKKRLSVLKSEIFADYQRTKNQSLEVSIAEKAIVDVTMETAARIYPPLQELVQLENDHKQAQSQLDKLSKVLASMIPDDDHPLATIANAMFPELLQFRVRLEKDKINLSDIITVVTQDEVCDRLKKVNEQNVLLHNRKNVLASALGKAITAYYEYVMSLKKGKLEKIEKFNACFRGLAYIDRHHELSDLSVIHDDFSTMTLTQIENRINQLLIEANTSWVKNSTKLKLIISNINAECKTSCVVNEKNATDNAKFQWLIKDEENNRNNLIKFIDDFLSNNSEKIRNLREDISVCQNNLNNYQDKHTKEFIKYCTQYNFYEQLCKKHKQISEDYKKSLTIIEQTLDKAKIKAELHAESKSELAMLKQEHKDICSNIDNINDSGNDSIKVLTKQICNISSQGIALNDLEFFTAAFADKIEALQVMKSKIDSLEIRADFFNTELIIKMNEQASLKKKFEEISSKMQADKEEFAAADVNNDILVTTQRNSYITEQQNLDALVMSPRASDMLDSIYIQYSKYLAAAENYRNQIRLDKSYKKLLEDNHARKVYIEESQQDLEKLYSNEIFSNSKNNCLKSEYNPNNLTPLYTDLRKEYIKNKKNLYDLFEFKTIKAELAKRHMHRYINESKLSFEKTVLIQGALSRIPKYEQLLKDIDVLEVNLKSDGLDFKNQIKAYDLSVKEIKEFDAMYSLLEQKKKVIQCKFDLIRTVPKDLDTLIVTIQSSAETASDIFHDYAEIIEQKMKLNDFYKDCINNKERYQSVCMLRADIEYMQKVLESNSNVSSHEHVDLKSLELQYNNQKEVCLSLSSSLSSEIYVRDEVFKDLNFHYQKLVDLFKEIARRKFPNHSYYRSIQELNEGPMNDANSHSGSKRDSINILNIYEDNKALHTAVFKFDNFLRKSLNTISRACVPQNNHNHTVYIKEIKKLRESFDKEFFTIKDGSKVVAYDVDQKLLDAYKARYRDLTKSYNEKKNQINCGLRFYQLLNASINMVDMKIKNLSIDSDDQTFKSEYLKDCHDKLKNLKQSFRANFFEANEKHTCKASIDNTKLSVHMNSYKTIIKNFYDQVESSRDIQKSQYQKKHFGSFRIWAKRFYEKCLDGLRQLTSDTYITGRSNLSTYGMASTLFHKSNEALATFEAKFKVSSELPPAVNVTGLAYNR